MGVVYEMNWYLVAADKSQIIKINDNEYMLQKSDRRVYPIDSEIPLIIKNLGCIAIVKINKFEIDKSSTNIIFSIVKEYNSESEIAKHYYEMYMNMKRM
ncbi:DUF2584 family protein [Crassaminicella indica]|uniref:DUF2584 family protein n=1 Tax=Crassaminicella indica TaxID=2855394 RepID=A0ABX8RHA0_9CLOT|nr:DUF2584 family protein [Crassaminicella indica]QXM07105.1 DUF2584 family protein [Crassaminicella indica]